ncbi:MAG: DUF2332 domain-containing protein [Acidimicrobiia bacterium]
MTTESIEEAFAAQAEWCNELGSPLYGTLLAVALNDLERNGPVATIVDDFPDDPLSSALALRLMGGLHRLVLMGLAPDLARHYPSAGGVPDLPTLADDFLETVATHVGYLSDSLSVAPQTNEIGRCAALLPLLFTALEGRKYDIRLLEIGSAAGLNLFLDRYSYDFGSWTWGEASSGVVIATDWDGAPPKSPPGLAVTSRRGCDVSPMDISDEQGILRLLSFIWPDQVVRFTRTQRAAEIVSEDPPVVDPEPAGSWLAARLAEPVPDGTMTVVQHSVMWQYLAEAEKLGIAEAISEAGERSTPQTPLAHTSFEWPANGFTDAGHIASVATWPGGSQRTVGRGQAHGSWIEWTG